MACVKGDLSGLTRPQNEVKGCSRFREGGRWVTKSENTNGAGPKITENPAKHRRS